MERLPLWAVVRIALIDTERDASEFTRWYNEVHVPEFVAEPGIDRGWRTEKAEHPDDLGAVDEQYAAIYEIDSIDSFRAALDTSPTAGHSWFEWEGRIRGWQRTFFRVIARLENDSSPGAWWAIVRVNYAGGREAEFNRWYDEEHFPGVASHAGFHRAWRLRHEPDGNQLGADPHRYWAVYEIDDPADLREALRGKEPWGGVWQPEVSGWTRSYHRLLLDHRKEAPQPALSTARIERP